MDKPDKENLKAEKERILNQIQDPKDRETLSELEASELIALIRSIEKDLEECGIRSKY